MAIERRLSKPQSAGAFRRTIWLDVELLGQSPAVWEWQVDAHVRLNSWMQASLYASRCRRSAPAPQIISTVSSLPSPVAPQPALHDCLAGFLFWAAMIFAISIDETGRAILDSETHGDTIAVIEASTWQAARHKALKNKAMDKYSHRSGYGWYA